MEEARNIKLNLEQLNYTQVDIGLAFDDSPNLPPPLEGQDFPEIGYFATKMLESSSMYQNASHHHYIPQETLSVAQFFKKLTAQTSRRVKVYLLNSDGKWDDQGTGHVAMDYIQGSEKIGLFVYDEEDSGTILLHHICSEDIYRREEDTIISWRDQDISSEIALSFQEYTCCSYTWHQICNVQRSHQFNSLNTAQGERRTLKHNSSWESSQLFSVRKPTLVDILKHKEHFAGENKVNETVEESPAPDVGFAMNTTSQSFNSGTKKSQHCKEIIEIEEDPLVLYHRHSGIVEDPIHNKGRNVGAEQCKSAINAIDETCLEETSVEGYKPENEINYEILSEHFGKSLDDAANIFHVSRSTFKRICRTHGIKRWRCGKRRMGIRSSSLRKVNDKESSKTNDVYSGITPLQDIAVAHTSQDMNKINVKATYNGIAIRFELLNSSGMAELEENVIERLKLERDAFSIKYKDDDGDWVLIACDKDVQKCIEISRSLSKTIITMMVDLPISRYGP